MEPQIKGAIAATILIIAIPAALATFLTAVDPGEYRPIQVRTQDGMPPVDKVYTYTDATYTDVEINCQGNSNIVITARVVTYDGMEITKKNKEELTKIMCETLE